MTCKVSGCHREVHARGYCGPCYERLRRNRDLVKVKPRTTPENTAMTEYLLEMPYEERIAFCLKLADYHLARFADTI